MKLTPSKEEKKLKKLLDESQKILVTGHQRIDPDAVCSILVTIDILKQIYPEKDIDPIIQETNYNWPINTEEVFPGIGKIKNLPNEEIDLDQYDLVLVEDANRIGRCLSKTKGKSKITVIDHHDSKLREKPDIFINEGRSSNVEQLYITFKRIFNGNFKISKDTASLIYFGITADNGRFLYDKVSSDTFQVVADIYDIADVNPQKLEKNVLRLTRKSLISLKEVMENMKCDGNYCYSYITKEFIDKHNLTNSDVTSGGKDYFLSNIIVNTQGLDWGFMVYPIPGENRCRVSFRSFRNTEDVQKYARQLGGGGHINASAASINAKSIE
jgi:phosphoesterase RecJ-like protein